MKAIICLGIIGLLFIHGTCEIVGYDCGTTNLNITTVSLLDVGQCNIPLIEPHVEGISMQLLQLSKFEAVDVIQCKVAISRTVYYCGMHSHISTVNNAHAEYIFDTTLDQCKTMHRTGTLVINVNNVISGLKINMTSTRPITFAGSVSTDGKCSGVQYSDPYGTWQNVVVQGTITISLASHRAMVSIDANQIHLSTGSICRYSSGNCVDIVGRYTFWETIPNDHCRFGHYDVLYEGKAKKMVNKVDNRMQTVYSLSTQDVTFALSQIGEELHCGYTLIKTEHPKLIILETHKGESFIKKKPLAVENMDIFTYVNSKFVYVERHIRTQLNQLYTDVLKQRCDLERQVLKNALSLAMQAPDDFAYQIMRGPGYMSTLSGEVVHITKCTPVEVKLQHSKECYQQLPVLKGNETYFLAPRTHILFRTGTQVTCSRVLPIMYFLNDGWYSITPNVEYSKTPETMKPMTKPTWQYSNPGSLAASGIYTSQDLEKLRDHIMFPAEKNAILNTMARGVKGEAVLTQGISLSHLLDENTLQRITENAWKKIWGTFLSFGNATSGIIGVYFCIRTLKLVVDTIVHGYALHTIYGWSIHIIGAVWDSVTNLLLHLGRRAPKNEENKGKEENQEPSSQQENVANTPHTPFLQSSTYQISLENEKKPGIHNESHSVYPQL